MKSLKRRCLIGTWSLFLAFCAPLAASKGSISYTPLPLRFQSAGSPGCFTADASGFQLTLRAGEAVLDLGDGATPLHLRMAAAHADSPASALELLPGRTFYLRGEDPTGWRTNVPSWGRVQYRGIYPGIDLVFYGRQNELEYDFTVAPGADLGAIRLDVSGALAMRVDSQGNVVLTTETGEVNLRRPRMYQMVAGRKHNVAGGFRLSHRQIAFSAAAYDRRLPLVVDPVLSYATFIGRGVNDRVNAIAVAADGSTWATGVARATAASGYDEAFVAHLSTDGKTLESMTYLGGSGASEARGVALDTAGNVFITGQTAAADFPVLNAINPFCDMNPSGKCNGDAFVAKLGPDGSPQFATYLGGSGADAGNGIAVDSAGDVYVAGVTDSRDFPAVSAAQPSAAGQADGFVAKISGDGSRIIYATYLGGSGADQALGIAVDSKLNAYVTGQTDSFDFPTAQPMQAKCHANPVGQCAGEAFVTKLSADGTAFVYSTYLGGSGGDQAYAIAVDAEGQPHIAGVTSSDDFPLTSPIQPKRAGKTEAFVAGLRADGSALLYSTFLGGTGDDAATAIALDANGLIYVGGHTDSADFPLKSPVQKTCKEDPRKGVCSQDAFVAVLSKAGAKLNFSTYLGGTGTDQGNGIAVARNGGIHLGGASTSTDFPSVRSAEAKGASAAHTVHAGALVAKLTPMAQTCTINWTGGGSDKNWSTTANWSNSSGPGSGDAVCIGSSFASITVIVDADDEIGSLTSSASIEVEAALTVDDTATFSNKLTIDGGSYLILNGSAGSTVSGNLALSGTLQGTDSLTITGTLAFQDGAELCGSDCSSTPDQPPVTSAKGGITTPSAGANVYLYGRELDNSKTATFNGGTSYSFTADNGAIVSNLVGATWTLKGDNYMGGGNWQFNNAGTFTKSSGTGTSSVTPTTFTNTGTASAANNTGILAIQNPAGASGTWQAGTSATLQLSSASSSTLGGTFSGAGSLGFTGGIINLTSATTISLAVTIDDCDVNFATGATSGSGVTIPSAKLQDNGILGGTDTLTISGALAWNGGTTICSQMASDGSCVTPPGTNALLYVKGSITTSSQATESLWGRTLNNSGTATFNASGCGLDLGYGAVVNNSGTWNLANQCGIGSSTSDGMFNNLAMFTSANSSGQISSVAPQAFVNTGSVQVNSGILSVFNPVNTSSTVGTWSVAAGAGLQLSAGVATSFSTNFGGAFTGPGALEFAAYALNLTYPSSFNLPVVIDQNAIANFMTGSAVPIQSLTIMGAGTLTGPDTVTVSGTLTWNDGGNICAAMSGAGCVSGSGVLNAYGGIVTQFNTNENWYLSYRTLNIRGTAAFSGLANSTLTLDGGSVNNLAPDTVNHLPGGTWNITGDSAINATPNGGTFTNAGTFEKTGGTSASLIVPASFTSTGSVIVTCSGSAPCSDILSIENLGNSSGSWSASSGATLQLGAGSSPATLAGTFSGTSASSIGQLQFTSGPLFASGGIIDIVSPATFNLPVTINDTSVNFQTGSEVKLPSLTLANYGTVAGPDTVTVNGMFTWQNNGYACTSLTANGTCDTTTGGILNANGGITLPGGASQYLLGRTLNNPGPGVTVSATNTAACGGQSAWFQLGYSAIVNNGGTWNFAGDCTLYVHNTTGTFNNSGTFEKTQDNSVNQIYSGITFANSGTVIAGSGTLEFQNGYTQTTGNGNTFLDSGAIIADAPLLIQGGSVSGSGTITGDVNNAAGTLAPGTPATQSTAATTGTIGVSGNYSQAAAAAFNVKIGGTGTGQYDVLAPGTNAALLGTLNVSLINNFSPAINNSFTIVNGPYSGTFSPINYPSLPAGEGWSIAYNSNAVVLTIVAVNGPAAKVNPANLTFDNTPVGQASGVKTVTLSNIGTTAMTIGSIQVTGTDPNDFQYTKDASAPCGATLAAGSSCTLDITFTPKYSGARSAQITITDNSGNANNATQTVGLSGAGIALSSISIAAANSSIAVNTTDQFTATGTYTDQSTADITSQVSWYSSPTGLVTFSTTTPGLATAGAVTVQTNVTITASLSGVTSTGYQLTITPASQNSIALASGSSQSTPVSTAFNPLVAVVRDGNGNPLSGVSVTFTAPSSGASGTFSNNQATYATTTNSSGLASANFTANATAGSYSVTATITGTSMATSFSLTNTSATAGLSITKTHTGNFIPGQTNAAYTITVTNNGTAATSGPVTVTDSPPTGLTVNQMTGTGWTCGATSCTSNAAMASGQMLSITVTATVANNASAPLTNQASVSLNGTTVATASNVTVLLTGITVTAVSSSIAPQATDQFTATGTYSDGSTANLTSQVTWASGSQNVATINSAGLATGVAGGQSNISATLDAVSGSTTLTVTSPTTIAVSSGSPQSAQVGTAFASLVAVVSGSPVAGQQVTFTAPSSGASGTFSNGQTTYTAATNSSGQASATFTANATVGSYTVTATVAGASSPANFSLSNTAAPPPVLSIAKTHSDPFLQGQTNATYTVTVSNAAGAGPTSGTVTVTETLPSGMALVSISGGTTWNCTPTQPAVCTTNQVLNPNTTYTPITVTVNVLGNAASPQVNNVSVSGGGSLAGASTTDTTNIVAVTTNTLTIPAAIGAAPSGTFSIPLTLALSGNTSIDSLTFALEVTPVGGAPALSTQLSFTPDSSITDTPLVSTNGTDYAISVAWSSFTKTGNLSGTRVIGTVTGTVPSGAAIGQTYTVTITGAGATNGGQVNLVTVTPGPNGTLTVSNTYWVGDVDPYTGDMAPNFGLPNGVLNNLDVDDVLFAVNKVPGFVPEACSDRFDAMDTYPVDTATTRGGDGSLDIRDLIREMFRASLLDMSRPTRASRGGCATPSSQTAKAVATPGETEASLSFGVAEALNDTEARMPVYLDARGDLARVALTFALGDQHSRLAFVPARVAPSLSPPGEAGIAAVAWLEGVTVRSGERLLLGYVEGPAAALPGVQLYGMSAVRLDDDQMVRLDAPGLLAGSR
jgi:uncharacterized repeat protein (TIGR01451 family)